MSTQPEQVNGLIASVNALKAYFEGIRERIDAKVVAKEAEVDASILSLGNSHAQVIISYYDATTHSKSSLGLVVDPSDETVSNWAHVPTSSGGHHMYPSEGKLTKVHTKSAVSTHPGYYETVKYTTDHSCTFFQFVLANDAATSDQINNRLSEIGQSPQNVGGWWDGTRVGDIPTVRVAGLHPYSRLFVRAVNVGVDGKSAQHSINFGGNSSFSVDRVINYPTIARG